MQQTPIAVGQNYLAGLRGGMQAGQEMRQANDQNALRNIFATQDVNDPAVQQQIMGLDPRTGMALQDRAYQREQDTYQRGRQQAADGRDNKRLELAVQAGAQAAEHHAAKMDAVTLERERAETQRLVSQLATAKTPEQWDAIAKQNGGEDYVGRFDDRETVFAFVSSLEDTLARQAGPKAADEYGRYVQEETAAGRKPLSRIDYTQAKKGKGTVVYDPATGKPLVSIGGAATDDTDISSPSSPAAMVSSIDGVLNDPALDFATGFLEWTQNIPGTASRRFGSRVDQLNGQAFLQAFESLKGAGQITEVEGQKATQAIGRLDSAQSADDYRQALNELKGILQIGMERKKTGGVITSDAPGVTEVDLNGTIYRVQKVD